MPSFLSPPRPRPAVTRRGQRFDPPWLPAPWTPAFLRSRPRRPPSLRRRRFCEPPWITAAPAVPAEFLPPQLAARRRPPAIPARRGRRFSPPWPFVEAPTPNVFSSQYDQHSGAVTHDTDSVAGQTTPEPDEVGAITTQPVALEGSIS